MVEPLELTAKLSPLELELLVGSLKRDHTRLSEYMPPLAKEASCIGKRVRVRAHYLRFQEHEPMVSAFLQIIVSKLVPFCFHNAYLRTEYERIEKISDPDIRQEEHNLLLLEAFDLFIRGNKNTKRTGEFGELIAYLLIEWIIDAPQVLAKMILKTNPEMPVHGADGLHAKFDAGRNRMMVFFGEAKCRQDVNAAIKDAVKSLAKAFSQEKMAHELLLVKHHYDDTGLPKAAREQLLDFLNPYGKSAAQREYVAAVFIAFDFDGFKNLNQLDVDEVIPAFEANLAAALDKHAAALEAELQKASIHHRAVEAFFLPDPSVAAVRKAFHQRIGWKDDPA